MKLPKWEVERIKARIEKAQRRIAKDSTWADKRGETEHDRIKRLEWVLINAGEQKEA